MLLVRLDPDQLRRYYSCKSMMYLALPVWRGLCCPPGMDATRGLFGNDTSLPAIFPSMRAQAIS